jgi:hypothetical protein
MIFACGDMIQGQIDAVWLEGFMLRKLGLGVLLWGMAGGLALAADSSGKWSAEFDTQVGKQSYTYEFHVDGAKVTGKAVNSQFGSHDIQEGKIDGDTISFVESMDFQGTELRITYTGKIDGDEIKFTRKVGDFATEEFAAKRVK